MEQALMAVCKDIRLGKILIQTNHNTGEPEVRTGCPFTPFDFVSLYRQNITLSQKNSLLCMSVLGPNVLCNPGTATLARLKE